MLGKFKEAFDIHIMIMMSRVLFKKLYFLQNYLILTDKIA